MLHSWLKLIWNNIGIFHGSEIITDNDEILVSFVKYLVFMCLEMFRNNVAADFKSKLKACLKINNTELYGTYTEGVLKDWFYF